MKKAVQEGIEIPMIREAVLTTYLFDGYPTALEGFRLLSKIFGIDAEYSSLEYSPENIKLWKRRGDTLCRQIYGPQFESLMSNVNSFAPELQEAMIVEGYGKVLSRTILPIAVRELVIVSILVFKRKPRQLLSHALGALRVGADPKELHLSVAIGSESLSNVEKDDARRIIESAIKKHGLP